MINFTNSQAFVYGPYGNRVNTITPVRVSACPRAHREEAQDAESQACRS